MVAFPKILAFAFVVSKNKYPRTSLETFSDTVEEICSLDEITKALNATPQGLLRLESPKEGERGVFLNQPVKQGNVMLRLDLDSCLRDDDPPAWYSSGDSSTYHHASECWATRLAASLIHEQQLYPDASRRAPWLQMLPPPELLRATLPIHWPEQVLAGAKCTSLELAVDSTYFSRAEAVADLLGDLEKILPERNDLEDVCHNALDLVQTRSCRVTRENGAPIRLLAPIFDFMNHSPNPTATFGLESDKELVVRATRDLKVNEQVFIDYGDSTRPSWTCLSSYGFVPENEDDDDVAEVWVHGKRYKVGPSTVPADLVTSFLQPTSMEDYQNDTEVLLTPEIALRIAERVSEVAYQYLLDPCDEDETDESLAHVISSRLAAQLRWSQHRTLCACATGLRHWAAQQAE